MGATRFGQLETPVVRKRKENEGFAPRKGQWSQMGPFAYTEPTRSLHGAYTDFTGSNLESPERLGSHPPQIEPQGGPGWPGPKQSVQPARPVYSQYVHAAGTTHARTHTRAHTHTHTDTRAHTHTDTHASTHAQTQVRRYTHAD